MVTFIILQSSPASRHLTGHESCEDHKEFNTDVAKVRLAIQNAISFLGTNPQLLSPGRCSYKVEFG